MEEESPYIKMMVRLPRELRATISSLAEREERSVNAQIVYLLRVALGER